MANSFTCFAKFGDVLEQMNETDRAAVEIAICEYGFFGAEPTLKYPLNIVFELIKDDINNSKKARNSGSKGGKSKTKTPLEEVDEAPLAKTKTPLSQNEQANTVQNNTVQNRTIQEREGAKRKRFTPPTPAEVDTFAKTLDYYPSGFDPEHFCDYYAAQGWKLANGNVMKDWHAAVRNWLKRDMPQKTEKEAKLDELYREYGEVYDAKTVYFDEL